MRPRGGRLPDGVLGPAALRAIRLGALRDLALAVALGYVAIAILVWFAQERLMFHPRGALAPPTPPPGWRLETVRLTARDGTTLAGVLAQPAATRDALTPARGPLVIHFGGNAEEATELAGSVHGLLGERAVLLVNYRGYGESGGSPGEKALVSDALELYDWAARRPDVDPARIAVHGRSLGTGVAVQLAAARPVRCVVLTSPFASALEVARNAYPWLPVGLLMRHPFDSAARAPNLAMPALVVIGTADTLIPPAHSERLAAAWAGPVERLRLEGFGHNDLSLHPGYNAAIRAFLDRNL
jgi:fermentation-respiration switch protein FrsA (DUF1100 family)